MLNQSFPNITAVTTLWVGIQPEECDRQAQWTPDVSRAFEKEKASFKQNGVEIHFIEVPGTNSVALGVRIKEFEVGQCLPFRMDRLTEEASSAKADAVKVLKELGYREIEKEVGFFFTTSFRRVIP
ncbi:MAG: hypothetical protein NUV54_01725 [Candidatus Taylorbacteria bacterium]|nr:hypothetical protein [Candidatus Taylorbacteria bacterium]